MDKAKGSEEEMTLLFEAAKEKSWNVAKLTSRGSQTPDWRRRPQLDQSQFDQTNDAALVDYIHITTRHHRSVPPNQRIR